MTRGGTGPAIAAAGLVKRYGGRSILDGVDLEVGAGEIVALLGPNGAGKTTTVEIIEGYRQPDGGTVRVLGNDPWRAGPALRARVGLMLQDGGLDPRTTPRDVLRLYAAFHDGGRDPDELLDQVGLRTVASTRVRRLSGGERQRLSLALALVGEPEVLVLDEPTAGMDPEAKRSTRSLVAGLRNAGRAILLTTHDLADVEALADRVAILARGRIVAAGTPGELGGSGSPRVRVLLDRPPDAAAFAKLQEAFPAGPTAGAELHVVAGVAGARGEEAVAAEHGASVHGAALELPLASEGAAPAVIASLVGWAADHELRIVELRAGSGGLEERYFELTGDHDIEAVP